MKWRPAPEAAGAQVFGAQYSTLPMVFSGGIEGLRVQRCAA